MLERKSKLPVLKYWGCWHWRGPTGASSSCKLGKSLSYLLFWYSFNAIFKQRFNILISNSSTVLLDSSLNSFSRAGVTIPFTRVYEKIKRLIHYREWPWQPSEVERQWRPLVGSYAVWWHWSLPWSSASLRSRGEAGENKALFQRARCYCSRHW